MRFPPKGGHLLGTKPCYNMPHLSATQAAKMREDLDRLPPRPKMADKLNVGERLYVS